MKSHANQELEVRSLEEQLLQATRSDVRTVRQAAAHIVGSGGKRLRPRFAEAVGRDLGVSDDERSAIGVAAELLHTATLIHDDVIDRSEQRRGRPALHSKFGLTNAVLTGDFFFAQALSVLTQRGLYAAIDELSAALTEVVEAEVLQHERAFDPATTLEESRRIAEGKTGALFAWCARSLARLADHTQATVRQADDFGRHFGYVFQIGDDLLDFAETDTGKPRFKDLREGVLSSVVQVMRAKTPVVEPSLCVAFEQRTDSAFDEAYRLLVEHGVQSVGSALKADELKAVTEQARSCLGSAQALRLIYDVFP